MPPALTGDMPAVHESVAWAWPVTPSLADHVRDNVSAAYTAWGTTLAVADTTGDLAIQLAQDVLKAEPDHQFVCVTAGLSGRLLVLSVAPALSADDNSAGLTLRAAPPPGARPAPVYAGRHRLECGRLCLYALINLLPQNP
ncbi:hypothetical protein [Streptomyces sp. NBC_00134]|uniref:hypothetical protein n=1 Tax=Streptomyces sp. NBC_00134 TaxID=2975663 RepID=UPI002F90CAC0